MIRVPACRAEPDHRASSSAAAVMRVPARRVKAAIERLEAGRGGVRHICLHLLGPVRGLGSVAPLVCDGRFVTVDFSCNGQAVLYFWGAKRWRLLHCALSTS